MFWSILTKHKGGSAFLILVHKYLEFVQTSYRGFDTLPKCQEKCNSRDASLTTTQLTNIISWFPSKCIQLKISLVWQTKKKFVELTLLRACSTSSGDALSWHGTTNISILSCSKSILILPKKLFVRQTRVKYSETLSLTCRFNWCKTKGNRFYNVLRTENWPDIIKLIIKTYDYGVHQVFVRESSKRPSFASTRSFASCIAENWVTKEYSNKCISMKNAYKNQTSVIFL